MFDIFSGVLIVKELEMSNGTLWVVVGVLAIVIVVAVISYFVFMLRATFRG